MGRAEVGDGGGGGKRARCAHANDRRPGQQRPSCVHMQPPGLGYSGSFLLTSMWSRASSMLILACAGRSSPAVASDSSNFTPRSDIGLAIGYGRRWGGCCCEREVTLLGLKDASVCVCELDGWCRALRMTVPCRGGGRLLLARASDDIAGPPGRPRKRRLGRRAAARAAQRLGPPSRRAAKNKQNDLLTPCPSFAHCCGSSICTSTTFTSAQAVQSESHQCFQLGPAVSRSPFCTASPIFFAGAINQQPWRPSTPP